MASDDVTGLMALVAYGAANAYLHYNIKESIYQKPIVHNTHTAFTYKSQEFKCNNNNFQLTLNSDSDMLSECFVDCVVCCEGVPDVSSLLETCTFSAKSKAYQTSAHPQVLPIETLTGKSIAIFANTWSKYNMIYEPVGDDTEHTYHVMIPLPFFFTFAIHDALPMALVDQNRIGTDYIVQASFGSTCSVRTAKFVYKSIYLDSWERMSLYKTPFIKLICTSSIITVTSPTNYFTINIPTKELIRDIQLHIIDASGQVIKPEKINVLLNGHKHMSLNYMLANRIIPCTSYKTENIKGVSFIPFCSDPLGLQYTHTSNIDSSRLDHMCLVIQLQSTVTNMPVSVTAVLRHHTLMRFNKGECMMGW